MKNGQQPVHGLEGLAVYQDLGGIDLCIVLGGSDPSDRDASVSDEPPHFSAGAVAQRGEELIQSSQSRSVGQRESASREGANDGVCGFGSDDIG